LKEYHKRYRFFMLIALNNGNGPSNWPQYYGQTVPNLHVRFLRSNINNGQENYNSSMDKAEL
jgi:hypothetical protein